MTILLGGAGLNKCNVTQLTAMISMTTGMDVNVTSFQEKPDRLPLNIGDNFFNKFIKMDYWIILALL
jgi:hypothetical protein